MSSVATEWVAAAIVTWVGVPLAVLALTIDTVDRFVARVEGGRNRLDGVVPRRSGARS